MLADIIILAGGFGTRLQSVVADRPKCMADIQGKPFLHYLCRYVERFQPRKVIFSVGYLKEQVIEYIEANSWSFEYAFAEETEPLGTGGAVLNSLSYVDTDDFFILNGDTFFEVDLEAMLAFQKSKMADATLALKPMAQADRYGLVQVDTDDSIISFKEKQAGSSGFINGGVYCVFRKGFESIPFPQKFSFEKDYLEEYLTQRSIFGLVQDHYFIDIGIPEDYERAQKDLGS
jgi:D-glycero-alpha-D-manno-heptose 1-phosphate guanylyltransferase